MQFAVFLKRFREENNLSQSQLSRLTNIPQTTISGWERGQNSPSINQITKLSKSLKLNISDLFNSK